MCVCGVCCVCVCRTIHFTFQDAVNEIEEAAKVMLEQVDLRFLQLPVLSTLSLFAIGFDRARVKADIVNEKLRILADHLAYDLATCQREFDAVMEEVILAKKDVGF